MRFLVCLSLSALFLRLCPAASFSQSWFSSFGVVTLVGGEGDGEVGASPTVPRRDLRDDALTEDTEAPHVPKSWGAIEGSTSKKRRQVPKYHQMCPEARLMRFL